MKKVKNYPLFNRKVKMNRQNDANNKNHTETTRGSRISYNSAKLTELNALRDKLEQQRLQLEEELKQLKTNKFVRRHSM